MTDEDSLPADLVTPGYKSVNRRRAHPGQSLTLEKRTGDPRSGRRNPSQQDWLLGLVTRPMPSF